ncbi:MAG: hypothetical protein QNJ31_07465 [Candidatus Caenarcaniphilales bacterium]|nr:hypothetical protein [Candidatus Caenarcaniphilales bacterium]
MKDFFNRLIKEEDAALDQWISVLVLAILAIILFLALRGPISTMLQDSVQRVGQETQNLFNGVDATAGNQALQQNGIPGGG